ncbi:putative methyltransferase [Nymphaea thermarum]|nr:putative methyltransferase [Nymphaea thermarum]
MVDGILQQQLLHEALYLRILSASHESHPRCRKTNRIAYLLPSPPPSPSPDYLSRSGMAGLLDENGTMANKFFIGEFGPNEAENLAEQRPRKEHERGGRVSWLCSSLCPESMKNKRPLDNKDRVQTARKERFERHCPHGNRFR